MAGFDTNRGSKRAREARARAGLRPDVPIPCVVGLAEERFGVPVLVVRLREGVAGCVWQDGEDRLIIVNGADAVVRRRFTVAHELGHLECAHGDVTVDTQDTISGRTHDPLEVQANAFAAELLVPAAALGAVVTQEPDLDELLVLASHFGVSTYVALFRCRTLGLLSPSAAQRLQDLISGGVDRKRWDDLGLEGRTDALSAMGADPVRVPPALDGSALAGVIRGEVSVRAAAEAAAVPELVLAEWVERLQLA